MDLAPPEDNSLSKQVEHNDTGKKGVVQDAGSMSIAREHERVPMKLDALTLYAFEAASAPAPEEYKTKGKLLDISKGGCQVQGPLPPFINPDDLSEGNYNIYMHIALPFIEENLDVSGSVRRAAPMDDMNFVYGIQFKNMPEDFETILSKFMISYSMRRGLR